MKHIKLIFIFLIMITGLQSCYRDSGDFLRTTEIKLTVDSVEKRLGEFANFTINTDSGINISNEAKLYYTDISNQITEELTSSSITSETTKTFEVYATYKEYTSNKIIVKFDDNFESFKKRVLIEDYTGTWCGNCTNVIYAIEQINLLSANFVTVAIHRGNDPFDFPQAIPLENLVNVGNAYPQARINRTKIWNSPQYSSLNLNEALEYSRGNPVRLGLAIKYVLSGNNIDLDVNVKFFEDFSNLRLVVYALENKLYYQQYNYLSTYANGVHPLPNFEHNHVLRATFTNILGDAIPNTSTKYNEIYTRNFSLPIPANISNKENLEFVAFVIDENNNAINVRNIKLPENQEFED